MINLLPPQAKEELAQEEKLKLVLILGSLTLVFFICLSLVILAINIYLAGELKAQQILLHFQEEELNSPQIKTLEQNLILFNQTLSRLNSFYQNRFKATEILEEISANLPSRVFLTNLSLTPNLKEAGKMSFNLTGFSPSRETLLQFKENLEKEELFEKVYFPPTNWVKAKDINFLVNFEIKKAK